MPDRYAEAVRRRRAELHAHRVLLAPGHRDEVRTACALTRIAVTAEVAATVAELGRQITDHVERAGRRERNRLPELVAEAARRAEAGVVRRTHERVMPALRRAATARGIDPGVVPEPLEAPPVMSAVPVPAPGRRPWHAVVTAGASWRLALLPMAGLPAGLPVLAGAPTLVPAVGLALLGLGWGAAGRVGAADRARWRQWAGTVTAAVRAALDAAVLAAVLQAEQRTVVALDAAVAARLAAVERELRELAPHREGVDALG